MTIFSALRSMSNEYSSNLTSGPVTISVVPASTTIAAPMTDSQIVNTNERGVFDGRVSRPNDIQLESTSSFRTRMLPTQRHR